MVPMELFYKGISLFKFQRHGMQPHNIRPFSSNCLALHFHGLATVTPYGGLH